MSVTDDFDFYSYEIKLSSNNDIKSQQLNYAHDFLNSITNRGFSAQITFMLNDEQEYKGSSFSSFLNRIKSIGDLSDDDCAIVKIIHRKDCCETLYILDSEEFVSFISKFSVEKQIKIINNKIFNHYESININNKSYLINSFFQSKEYNRPFVSNINELYLQSYSSELPPTYISYLSNEVLSGCEFHNYLKRLLIIMSLSLISHERDFKNSTFTFDSDRELSINDVKSNHDFDLIVYEVFLWVFVDDRYITRKSVFNSVISLQTSLPHAFNERLIGTLGSNLKILYKDNFESYLEARNDVLNFIYDLSLKMNDMINQKVSSSKNVLFVLISYFFTTFVFTGIDKGKVNNMFTIDVTVLSVVFIISSMIFIIFNQFEIEKNVNFLLLQRDEFKRRYETIFSTSELNDMFESNSLSLLVSNSRSRKYLYVYQVILFAIFSAVLFLYSIK